MATRNPGNVRHIEGYLCVSPTDLSIAFPHGGTAIGMYREMRFKPNVIYKGLTSMSLSGQVYKTKYCGERPEVECVLRDWDPDALNMIWPNTTLGVNGKRVIDGNANETGKNRGGYEISTRYLCFSPKDLETDEMLLVYAAVPLVKDQAELALSIPEEFGLPLVWTATPNASGRNYKFGLRELLTA